MSAVSKDVGAAGYVTQSITGKANMMKRRALRRNHGVKQAINKFWKVSQHCYVAACCVVALLRGGTGDRIMCCVMCDV